MCVHTLILSGRYGFLDQSVSVSLLLDNMDKTLMKNNQVSLLRLSDAAIKDLNILFLARFAPSPDETTPPDVHPSGGVFSFYHFELFQTLQSLGVKVTPCKDIDRFVADVNQYNYIFSVFNRIPSCRNGEMLISSINEYHGIPYLGAPPNIRALAEDKLLTKKIARSLGIPVLAGKVYNNEQDIQSPPDFEGPYFVKPRFGAASEDVTPDSFQEDWPSASAQGRVMLKKNKECLVEQGVPGSDITVPVLGGDAPIILPCAEEISEIPYGISTFKQKRQFEKKRQRIILQETDLCDTIQEQVAKLCQYVNPFDYMRVDFRLDKERKCYYLLEFNICCNLGSYAAIAQSAAHVGISQAEVVNHILSYSLARQSWSPLFVPLRR